ncbi:MAG: glycogen synthase [Myxococcota bacterium]
MDILFVTPECVPFAKAGGLGDVAGALPKALVRRGHDARIVLPLYGAVSRAGLQALPGPLGVPMGPSEGWCAVWEGELPGGVPVYFIEHEELYGAETVYGSFDAGGSEFTRFAFLCRAAFQLSRKLHWTPEIMHLHDWPTAPIASLLQGPEMVEPFLYTASVFTMHNVAHQPRFPASGLVQLDLGAEVFRPDVYEDFGAINPFKAAVVQADLLTTVSPTYAWEITTPLGGAGLHEQIAGRSSDLLGILNGIDVEVWNPARDPFLPAHYDEHDLSGKATCKTALQSELGLEPSDGPVFGMICRITIQKGVDLVLHAFDRLVAAGAQIVVLGTGDPSLEAGLKAAASRHPGRAAVRLAYDEGLAHRIEAGSDFFLMPSRFEPCGLNQMYSQRYGTPPIARRVGGLADSIDAVASDASGTGFLFDAIDGEVFHEVCQQAIRMRREAPHTLQAMQRVGMRKDFSWTRAALGYEEAYERARLQRANWVRQARAS